MPGGPAARHGDPDPSRPASRPPAAGPTHPAGGTPEVRSGGFEVRLENFSGPFDLLLGLIAKHRLDITEVSLATVTDEFIAYIRTLRDREGARALDEATGFLVVASTLLDLKAARLLPAGEVEDESDVALLEARDLLFARLLQYKAFKEAAGTLAARLAEEDRRFPRRVPLEPAFAALLPELIWSTGAGEFAALAARVLAPGPAAPTEVGLAHLHAPPVSVREQAAVLAGLLRGGGEHSFRALCAGAGSPMVVVARFLALLEMFRDRAVAFDQAAPLGELVVRWTAEERGWTPDAVHEEYGAGYDAGPGSEGPEGKDRVSEEEQ
ncbi:segregation/condensation protein A [Zafaria cholistanensis]|uniref:Segregation and condensation protein A n=1 Tax=Zafaria cholistanensis TaxID=1682741 RepID=A0A5A7NV55_9MICC|nr:segregation/condensation protein A [Zafaria cholistanensis]